MNFGATTATRLSCRQATVSDGERRWRLYGGGHARGRDRLQILNISAYYPIPELRNPKIRMDKAAPPPIGSPGRGPPDTSPGDGLCKCQQDAARDKAPLGLWYGGHATRHPVIMPPPRYNFQLQPETTKNLSLYNEKGHTDAPRNPLVEGGLAARQIFWKHC